MGTSRHETWAVIEMGTTSVRMEVAEVSVRSIRSLDTLQQGISLGRDTFTGGRIGPETTEACVTALKRFKRVMSEYGVRCPACVRVVATSAVRESSNMREFCDRVLLGAGLEVRVLDQAEVCRLTYLAVRPELRRRSFFKRGRTLVVEVGGGSTDVLFFSEGRIRSSHVHQLGSLRMSRELRKVPIDLGGRSRLMAEYMEPTLAHIREDIGIGRGSTALVSLGAEIRCAADVLCGPDRQSGGTVDVAELEAFVAEVMDLSREERVQHFGISFQVAETLVAALSVNVHLARALRVRKLHVIDVSMRKGLLADIQSRGAWTADFRRQVISSAKVVARRFGAESRAATNIAVCCRRLATALESADYHFSSRELVLLEVAAILHETGHFINNLSHHKHSMYIILNSDIFGLGSADIKVAALVARYHRRAVPKENHSVFSDLPRDERVIVIKLAAVFRAATALAPALPGRCRGVTMAPVKRALEVVVPATSKRALAPMRLQSKAELFEHVFGMAIEVSERDITHA